MSTFGVASVWAYVVLSLVFATLAGRHIFREDQAIWNQATRRERWVLVGHVLVIALMTMCLWPVLIVFIVLLKWFPRALPLWRGSDNETELAKAEPVFSVSPKDLGSPVTVAEVETNNYVTDPYEAVPALPFGHLHTRWLQLRSHVLLGHTLHPFDVLFQAGRYEPVRRHRGWAVVNPDRVVVSHWVAAIEVVNDPV